MPDSSNETLSHQNPDRTLKMSLDRSPSEFQEENVERTVKMSFDDVKADLKEENVERTVKMSFDDVKADLKEENVERTLKMSFDDVKADLKEENVERTVKMSFDDVKADLDKEDVEKTVKMSVDTTEINLKKAVKTYDKVMGYKPKGIQLTQKFKIDKKEVIDDDAPTRSVLKRSIKIKNPNVSQLGRSIFAKKKVTDDIVKSSSILSPLAQIPPLEEDLQLMPVSNNYELKNQFCEGAQGIISTAFDKSLKRDIVIKSLKREDDNEDHKDDESLFVSEARIMAQLEHPSIIPLYGLHCGQENKLHLAMKQIHGKTLLAYMEDISKLYDQEGVTNFDEKRSISTRLEYLIKVCEAVDYAHCKGVIHRDLKPENIMIGNYGEVYVMDWGLACLVDPEKYSDPEKLDHIQEGAKAELVGTPCYIAPELIRGGECSPQSDIFSLGMILFELVNLKRAVPGETVKEVLKNILRWNYNEFRHRFLKKKMHSDLYAIFLKATCEPPSMRYKRADDMAKDIKLFMRSEETEARPDNIFRRYVRTMIHYKTTSAMIILTVLLCLFGIATYSLYSQNRLMHHMEERDAMLTSFQSGVAQRAHKMEGMFLHLTNQLDNLVYRAGNVMSRKPSIFPKIYTSDNYLKVETCPKDFALAPSYGTKISADYAVFHPGKDIKLEDRLSKRLITLQPMFKHLLATSDPSFKNVNKKILNETIIEKGLPLSWIYFGLKNGSILSYPGKIYTDNFDPRTRLWYKLAMEAKNDVVWSEPYQDAFSSKIVLTCSRCVYDTVGRFQGVAGMDISLDYIQKNLFSNNYVPGVKEYLLNRQGDIILSSDFEEGKHAESNESGTFKLKAFPFLKEFSRAVKRRKVMFEAVKFGRKHLLAINRIPSLGYFYIEQVTEKELSKQWQRNNY